ncbi:MAG: ATP-binding cassette domain-containing protein [Synergistaceae bacterium]|nr:ATP-binding cassette domain-containing protein [Synergistaceae bacterium]
MAGWFDEQLRARIQADEDSFSDAFKEITQAVTGRTAITGNIKGAIAEIAAYFGVPESILKRHDDAKDTPIDEKLEEIFGPCGVMRRTVNLTEGWHKDAAGVYLGTTTEDKYTALIPDYRGYCYTDYDTGQTIRLNAETAKNLKAEAVCFYRPLPAEKLGVKDLLKFAVKSLSVHDAAYVALLTLAVTLVSMVSPYLMQILYSSMLTPKNMNALYALFVFMSAAGISGALLTVSKMLMLSRIETKADVAVNAAVMMRVINLPAKFFTKYSAGELAQRVSGASMLCLTGGNIVLSLGLTAIMSLVYLRQIFSFTPALVIPALGIMILFAGLTAALSLGHARLLKLRTQLHAQEYGILYAMITGIQKIRLSGSERRAFAKWAEHYSKDAALEFNPPIFLKLTTAIQPIVTLLGTFVLYWTAYHSGVSPENYMAFTASYGLMSGAFIALCGAALQMAAITPLADMIVPVLEKVPEISHGKIPAKVRGGIEISSVSFRYSPKSPKVLDKISFRVKAGEYVAIVGRSGCGKSTLMRLLLGFETPESGVIYYDNNDIKTLNLRALRRNIGCVMQNSRLFPGSIYENIVISAPHLSEADAWEAAEMAGIAEDIRHMPMQMNTMISEGAGTISGGQRQRIIIARAIAPKPKILLFDEATSALDNITQRIVSESLDGLKCTRVVIAHRLSTVRHCERILVIDGGKIAESGTYEELMNHKGLFASLVERQQSGTQEA